LIDIIFSTKDIASQQIFRQIITNYVFYETNETFDGNPILRMNNIRLITTNRELIYSDHLNELNSDLIIFASRHKSESGRPSLLVHCTGNWLDKADFGGNPREISVSSGSAMKIALIELFKQRKILNLNEFDVNLEVTHHGPTNLKAPLLFVELGSTPKDWENIYGALAVANAIMKTALSNKLYKTYIGVGGPHYATKFSELVKEPNLDFAVSHIIPKYALDFIDKKSIKMCIEKTKEKIEGFVFDWKGMNSQQKEKIISILNELNYPYFKTKEIKQKLI